jgi:hypothetical protein
LTIRFTPYLSQAHLEVVPVFRADRSSVQTISGRACAGALSLFAKQNAVIM